MHAVIHTRFSSDKKKIVCFNKHKIIMIAILSDESVSEDVVSSKMYLWCAWWSLLIPPPVMTPQPLMCYASHLVTIWAWLSSCVFLGSSGSIASAKGYMTEGGWGSGVIGCLFSSSNARRCHSHLYLLKPPFPPAILSHYNTERWQRKSEVL